MDIMKRVPSATLLLLLAFCALIKQGLFITCYMCNSARNDHACVSLTGNPSIFEQNCDHLAEARNQGVNYTICRKMFQKIFDPDGNEEDRIIRQCGTQGPLGCSKTTRPGSLQVETCHCNTPLCNAAPRLAHSTKPARVACLTAVFCLMLTFVHAKLL